LSLLLKLVITAPLSGETKQLWLVFLARAVTDWVSAEGLQHYQSAEVAMSAHVEAPICIQLL